MPGRRNPPAKWVLPDVIDPPDHLCITIPVPKNRYHIAAFWGALYNLTSARFWQDDLSHTALLVAKVWQDIYDNLKWGACDFNIPDLIAEMEYEMSICEQLRFQDGKLQGLCCGEWTDITGQGDSSLGGPGQPGGGAEQPAAGGGQACYHANQQGAFQWLAPTVVSSGDVLTFSNFDGAAWDGTAPFPLPGRWDCPDGRFFFAGECQDGTEALIGGDPLPTAPHMSLIAQINGTWYSCLSPITVPGGVSNAQVVVQLNDSGIGDNQGQYAFDLCVTNNAATRYSHLFDFAFGPQGWIAETPNLSGGWVGGKFIGHDNGSSYANRIYIHLPTGASIDHMTVHVDIDLAQFGLSADAYSGVPGAGFLGNLYTQGLPANSTADRNATLPFAVTLPAGTHYVQVEADGAVGSGYSNILSVIVEGPGTDPF